VPGSARKCKVEPKLFLGKVKENRSIQKQSEKMLPGWIDIRTLDFG